MTHICVVKLTIIGSDNGLSEPVLEFENVVCEMAAIFLGLNVLIEPAKPKKHHVIHESYTLHRSPHLISIKPFLGCTTR